MSKLQEIMNDVAKEQYDCSWVYACTFMHAGDVENLMKKVARRYATAVAEDALKRAAERAKLKDEIKHRDPPGGKRGGGSWRETSIDKQSILSTPINNDL